MPSHFTKSVICCQNSETQVVFKAHLRYTNQIETYSADDLITLFSSWISNGSTLTVVNTTGNVDSSLPTKLRSLTDIDCVDLNPDTLNSTSCPTKLNDDECDDPKSPAYDALIIIWECTLTVGVLFVIIITVTVILVTQYVHQRKYLGRGY